MIPIEVLNKYNMVSLEEYKLFDGDTPDTERMFYETFLIQTDHIPLKIFENFIEGMATANVMETIVVIVNFFKDIKVVYGEVLSYRKMAREKVAEILSATE